MSFDLKALETIVQEKKKKIEQNSYSKSAPLAKLNDQEKVAFLEPILHILKDMQERLDILELEKEIGLTK